MSRSIELDDKRRKALERTARHRKSSAQHLLEQAVDAFIERAEDDEELLEESARMAKRSGLRERDAVQAVRDWRQNQKIDLDKLLGIDQETEYRILQCAGTRQCSIQEAMTWLLKLGAKLGERFGYEYQEASEEQAQDRKAG